MAIMYTSLPETTTHLTRLESGIIVPTTTGQRTFVTERLKFKGFFDEDFVNYGTNVPSTPTLPVESVLYEMKERGNFVQVINSFNQENPDPLFWKSQDQILTWVEKYPQHLHPQGWATFFPFMVDKEKFVAYVHHYHRELRAHVSHFDYDYVWYPEYRSRWVFPQLTA